MKVILKENVASVGQKGSVVNVSEGYAINYLFARKLAQPATPQALKAVEQAQKHQTEKQAADAETLKTHLDALKNATITLSVKANEEGHLFAAIQPKDIVQAITTQKKITLDETHIRFTDPLKELGEHKLTIGTDDYSVSLNLNVTAE